MYRQWRKQTMCERRCVLCSNHLKKHLATVGFRAYIPIDFDRIRRRCNETKRKFLQMTNRKAKMAFFSFDLSFQFGQWKHLDLIVCAGANKLVAAAILNGAPHIVTLTHTSTCTWLHFYEWKSFFRAFQCVVFHWILCDNIQDGDRDSIRLINPFIECRSQF